MIKQGLTLLFFHFIIITTSSSQQIIALYTESIPNTTNQIIQEGISGPLDDPQAYIKTSIPTLKVFQPEQGKSNGTAVIIFPGGAYTYLAYQEEGTKVARYLANKGIKAFVVKYRLPNDSIMQDKSIGPLQDAQQAIKQVRMNATKWEIDSNKIGIMGFSAGGHLASTLGTHFTQSLVPNVEHTNLRPDFMILVYPVITMKEPVTHDGSRFNLLGANPTDEKVKQFSNEDQVTDNTPPTYITHTGDDKLVNVNNSIAFYQALIKHQVPTEMHLYSKGNHGFVLHLNPDNWIMPIISWMRNGKWLSDQEDKK